VIALRRAADRRYVRRRTHRAWRTFHPQDRADALADGFSALENVDEHRLPPSARIPLRPNRDVEIITYVLQGSLAYEDSTGRSGLIHAGEFQLITSTRGISHSQTNASRTDWAHVFHAWLRPSQADLAYRCEQKRFYAADRHGMLCVVASPDGRRGSLRIHQDVVVCSAILDPGHHLVHELSQGRNAWFHLVSGEAQLGDIVLTTGDGAGFSAERAVSLTARSETEILLLDLQEDEFPRHRHSEPAQ
jgi:redox-sensitive bicupin YhaK (pirin superfamily)